MNHKRLAPIALAAAMLAAASPALAGNGDKALRIEQLGPKHLLGSQNVRTDPITSTPQITFRTLVVEELGPKYLLH